MGEIPVDIYQKMANNRILFICNHIDDKIATDTVAALLLKDNENPREKITIFINSDGGDIRNVFMIYDMMQLIKSPIETICIGSAMDESAIILAAGTPGMRYATKHAAIAVSQLVNQWMSYSDLTDAKKNLDLYVHDNKKMMEIIAKCSNKTFKQTMLDYERRVFMNASQAIKHGIIDKVTKSSK